MFKRVHDLALGCGLYTRMNDDFDSRVLFGGA